LAARLDALENDNAVLDQQGSDSDEEFTMGVDDDGNEFEAPGAGKKRKGRGRGAAGARRTRGRIAAAVKPFHTLVEEAALEGYAEPNYLTASAGPSTLFAARKFCSVCSNVAPYTCVRCGAKYCCLRCFGTHSDTRCLKFMA